MVSEREFGPTAELESAVDRLYRHRFPDRVMSRRSAVWRVLCQDWFARYVPSDARLLEVAAGYCEFINNIRARERVAVDLNPETRRHAAPGVAVHEIAAERIADIFPRHYFDVVFISNFLEHCRSRDAVLGTLSAIASVLKPGGSLLVLGPNYRYCYREYFDYFDHYLPLSEKAVVEAMHLTGFEPRIVQARTLPYTFRDRLPSWPWLVRAYLRMPWLWSIFGAQFFVVAERSARNAQLDIVTPRAA